MNRLHILAGAIVLMGCSSDDVSSKEDAERAYAGLDKSIDKSIQLGFVGFNAASSANIDPQMGNGNKTGTLTISGKVDQGSSDNKTMTLSAQMKDYSDDGAVTYNTSGTLPVIDLKLSKIPNGTVDGTLNGTFTMTGELEGPIKLTLTIAAQLQPMASDPTKVERKPGTTKVVGTATSDYGEYNVSVTQ